MTSFTETHDKEPFDWHKALSQDARRISEEEFLIMKRLASDWVTCACGNQCSIIPRTGGVPNDATLRGLGMEFDSAVQYKEFGIALQKLDEIERRSAELIAQLTNE